MSVEVGTLLASRQIVVIVGDQRATLSPEQATKLENRLHDAVDQLDGRETSDALTMTLDEAAQEYESPK